MTPEEKYRDLYEQMYDYVKNRDGVIHSLMQGQEKSIWQVYLVISADDYSGEDAIDEDGGCEYKSTIGKSVNGTYNGISVQDTWELQEKYIVEDKIGKYQNHYYARFKGGKVEEVWKLGCDVVLDLLLPKIKKQFDEGTSHKKDPRIGVSIGQKEIESYGQRIR